MALQSHTIKAAPKSKRKAKRVGRGNGSQKGTYSSRGIKGQRSRSGGKSGTARRGFKQSLQKVPKIRGFKSIYAKKETVTLSQLERIAKKDEIITPYFLKKKGIIGKPKNGVKIVSSGEIKKAITTKGCLASKTALAAIEKAGGSVIA